MEFIDHQSEKPIKKSIGEILVERTGKVEKTEVYSNSKEILMIFPNDYAVTVKEKNSKKHAIVNVYWGVGDVTSKFIKGSNKLRSDSIMAFISMVEHL